MDSWMTVTLVKKIQTSFFDDVCIFFVKMDKCLPFDKAFIKCSAFTDFEKRNEITFVYRQTIFQDFIKTYKVAAENSSILNFVEEQFIDYLAFSRYHISENIGESAKTSDNDYQMDLIWATIFPNNPFPILPILC